MQIAENINLPDTLPDIQEARLPAVYEAAKNALAECSAVDECVDWADKAEALASYARQIKDDELEANARRIKARAIRRCGELLRDIEAANGANQNIGEGGHPKVRTRTDAARDAGLSDWQRKQSLRVANVPDEDFENEVEADRPATVTGLAERGTQTKPKPLVDLEGRDPNEFALATQIDGTLRELFATLAKTNQAAVVRGLFHTEHEALRANAIGICSWLERLIEQLESTDVIQS